MTISLCRMSVLVKDRKTLAKLVQIQRWDAIENLGTRLIVAGDVYYATAGTGPQQPSRLVRLHHP